MLVVLAIILVHGHHHSRQCLIERINRSIKHSLTTAKPHAFHVISTIILITSATMSQLQMNNPSLRVPGTNKGMFERAPVESGRKRGYFNDGATRMLLALTEEDYLQVAGTYGAKELGEYPVDFALLRNGSYDQRLMPFVPKRRGTMRVVHIELHQTNRQWKPSPRALRSLERDLVSVITQAEEAAKLTKLPLPEYAFELVPRLCYRDAPDDPFFEYQFQIWFELEAHYGRWRRAERAAGLLEGYTNVCRLLLEPAKEDWACGEPIGINFDPIEATDQDRELAVAYAFLKLPIKLPSAWTIPKDYSLRDAQAALLSEGRGSVAGRLSFPILQGLIGTDYDALIFSEVRPNFSVHRYNADGTRLTKQQRHEQANEESSDMYENEGSANEPDGDAPSGKITEIMEDVQPTGELALAPFESLRLALPVPSAPRRGLALQLDTTSSLAPPASTSNSASASASAPTSAASSASSLNAPAHSHRGPSIRRGRTARRQQRTREYPGSSRPPQRTEASRETWNQYFDSREARGASYDNRNPAPRASSSSLAPRTSATDVGPVRVVPQLRVLSMQAQPMLLHDTSSNQLVETAILSTDFSQSAVLQSALHQHHQPTRRSNCSPSRERNRSPPRERNRSPQRSRDRSRDRRRQYRQRSPSPEYRRRSPPFRPRSPARNYREPLPPREPYQGSRHHSSSRTRDQEPRPEGSSNFNQRLRSQYQASTPDAAYAPQIPDEDSSHGWGATSPLYRGPSGDDNGSSNPSTSRRD